MAPIASFDKKLSSDLKKRGDATVTAPVQDVDAVGVTF
jgi:hypothetical protein